MQIKAQKVIQWCMQCKWGFAIQMSQHKIFYAKKVTHLCCHSSSHWSYASFCTFSSSILHDFHGILETDSNLMRKYKKSEKLYNANWGIKSHMQCKWGFAIQMSQNNIFSCDYAKKMTHLCCQALSDWSYASLCTLTSSILHNFYKILETNSNPKQKYKKSEKLCGSRHKKSYAEQMRFLQYKRVNIKYFMPKRWLICAARPYLTDHMLYFVHSAHLFCMTFTGSWKLIQLLRTNVRNLKGYAMWIEAYRKSYAMQMRFCSKDKWK